MDKMFIYWWKDDNDTIKYRCRGWGPKYLNFYENWILSSSYRCYHDDFPWDYFVFEDPKDHQRLIEDYPNDVFEDKDY